MVKYNRSLDHVALGIVALRAGHKDAAMKHFMAASYSKDAPQAVRSIEVANIKAMQIDAAAKAEKPVKTQAASKNVLKVNAAERLKAAEDDEVTEEEVEMEDGDGDGVADITEEFDEGDAEMNGDDDFTAEMASVVASMQRKAAK